MAHTGEAGEGLERREVARLDRGIEPRSDVYGAGVLDANSLAVGRPAWWNADR